MSRRVSRLLVFAVGVLGVGVIGLPTFAIGYVDYERFQTAAARHVTALSVDSRWYMAPYSYYRLRGLPWDVTTVKAPSTGENITIGRVLSDGCEYFWAITSPPQ